MPGGFGVQQPKRRGGKTSLKEVRQLNGATKNSVQEKRDVAMQAEVEAFFAQYQQEHSDEVALAWAAGVHNPLAGMADTHARLLTSEEETWLGLAKAVGWLLVEDDLDALYFTAPPPQFTLEQADWYVRPDLTTFLEEPLLLHEVVQTYPVTLEVIQAAIAQTFLQLGWTLKQQEQFTRELLGKPATKLQEDDWELMLFELQLQVQDVG